MVIVCRLLQVMMVMGQTDPTNTCWILLNCLKDFEQRHWFINRWTGIQELGLALNKMWDVPSYHFTCQLVKPIGVQMPSPRARVKTMKSVTSAAGSSGWSQGELWLKIGGALCLGIEHSVHVESILTHKLKRMEDPVPAWNQRVL